MKRRDFLGTACALGIGGTVLGTAAPAQTESETENVPKKDHIELREYTVSSLENKGKLIDIFDNALVPALNRLGRKPVGVFGTDAQTNEGNGKYDLKVWVLSSHENNDSFITTVSRLLADEKFVTDAAPLFEAPVKDPLYISLKSTLLYGFDLCPKIEVPTQAKERIFQLRYYRSYQIERNVSKVHMFEEGGELALFRKSGMHPVFFGTTLFGDYMPNLTYMLGFANVEAKNEGWKKFGGSEEWKKINGNPIYKDTASEITNIFMRPSPGSQI